jgi:hypothetical protein
MSLALQSEHYIGAIIGVVIVVVAFRFGPGVKRRRPRR